MTLIYAPATSVERIVRWHPVSEHRKVMRCDPPCVLGGKWDCNKTPFAATALPMAIRDVVVNGVKKWQETEYFKLQMACITNGKSFPRGCTTREQLLRWCGEIEKLYHVIETDGYKTQEQLGNGGSLDDIRIGIGRHGGLVFLDGRHRLSIAQCLGLKIPMRVVVRHKRWDAFRKKVEKNGAQRRRGRIYQRIDHPDLRDIPYVHGDERWAAILPHIRGASGPALDIGAHWGHYSQQLSKLGIDTLAVEKSKSCCRFAEKVAKFPGSHFEVMRGDFCDVEHPERFKLVFALNIFHHLHKTEEGYNRLDKFLRKLRPEVMIFESHVKLPKGQGQMANAYSNLAPRDFAQWVGQRVGLGSIERIGQAADARLLFKLSK